MKIEIEIPEETVREAINKVALQKIVEHATRYASARYLEGLIEEQWKIEAQKVVAELFANVEPIREAARKQLERMLMRQLRQLMHMEANAGPPLDCPPLQQPPSP